LTASYEHGERGRVNTDALMQDDDLHRSQGRCL
jgi:hypothetical protein